MKIFDKLIYYDNGDLTNDKYKNIPTSRSGFEYELDLTKKVLKDLKKFENTKKKLGK